MAGIDRSVQLDATPDVVWSVVADPARFGEWLGMHKSWQGEVPERFEKGSRVTAVVGLLNIPATVEWTVDEYEPPRTVRLSGTGLAGVEIAIALDVAPDDAAGPASTLTLAVRFDGQLVSGAIGPAIENAAGIELDRSLERLRGLLAGND